MDVSGGRGRPRPGNDESAEHTGPEAPAPGDAPTHPAPPSAPTPADEQGARPEGPRARRRRPGPEGGTPQDTGVSGSAPGQDRAPAHPDHPFAHSGSGDGQTPSAPRARRGGLLMGRPFGVPVYVAPSWFLVAILITWVFGGQIDRVLPELGAVSYLVSLFFAVAFYASVLVHELAHTLAALRFKLPVRRIQLQFFGGVSEIEKEAETPGREFVLAFVGPLLSLVLAGLFYLGLLAVDPGSVPGVLLAGLMVSNLIVAAFNLLPGLPLDGGRMLRAVVWAITGRPMTGTVAAAWVGRALAVCVLIGLPLLTQSGALGSDAVDNVGMDTVLDALLAAILAAIIWTGAGNSLRMARLREHLPELRARTLTRRAVPWRATPRSPRRCAGPTRPARAPWSSSTPTACRCPWCGRPGSSACRSTGAPGCRSAPSPRTSPTACASQRNWPGRSCWTRCARRPPPSTWSSRRPARSTACCPPPMWSAPSSRPWHAPPDRSLRPPSVVGGPSADR